MARAESTTGYERPCPVLEQNAYETTVLITSAWQHIQDLPTGEGVRPVVSATLGHCSLSNSAKTQNKLMQRFQPLRHCALPSRQAHAFCVYAIECFVFVQCRYHAFDSALASQARAAGYN
jgi:hypothetical protein